MSLKPETIGFLQNLLERMLSMPIGIEILSDKFNFQELFDELEIPMNEESIEKSIIDVLKEITEVTKDEVKTPNPLATS